LPYLHDLLAGSPGSAGVSMGSLMRRIADLLQPPLNRTVKSVALDLTPFHCLEVETHAMDSLLVRQQFEFSAAHRLHVPSLSADENRRVFGKCNNPSGPGHNSRRVVAVRAPVGADGHVMPVEDLDTLVDEVVIQKLDHKHLNLDVAEFATLNPSVENIAKVIFEMLEGAVGRLKVELAEVNVWETSKTVCTYRGQLASVAAAPASSHPGG
jgi:6-pyruvoyltetrahydropterin/6-carboxytetrahydropterin synthase